MSIGNFDQDLPSLKLSRPGTTCWEAWERELSSAPWKALLVSSFRLSILVLSMIVIIFSGKGESSSDGPGKESSTATSKSGVEVLAFSQETMLSKEKHEEQLRKFQLEMRARTIAAPTNNQVCSFFIQCTVTVSFLLSY